MGGSLAAPGGVILAIVHVSSDRPSSHWDRPSSPGEKLLMVLDEPEFTGTGRKDAVELALESSTSFMMVFAHPLIDET